MGVLASTASCSASRSTAAPRCSLAAGRPRWSRRCVSGARVYVNGRSSGRSTGSIGRAVSFPRAAAVGATSDHPAERGCSPAPTRASSCCSRPATAPARPREGGVEAIVRDGIVARVRRPGTAGCRADGVLLTGTGDAARFLATRRCPAAGRGSSSALTAAGRGVGPGAERTPVVGGGPRLLRAGRVAVPARPRGLRPRRRRRSSARSWPAASPVRSRACGRTARCCS